MCILKKLKQKIDKLSQTVTTLNRHCFILLKLKKYINPFFASITIIFLLILISSGLGIIQPLLTKYLIDDVYKSRDWNLFLIVIGITLLIMAVSLITNTISSYISTLTNEKISFAIRKDLEKACSKANFKSIFKWQAGEFIVRFYDDVDIIVNILLYLSPNLIANIIRLTIILTILLYINVKVTLLFLILFPLTLMINILKNNELRPVQVIEKGIYERFNSFLTQYKDGCLTKKIFGNEKYESNKFGKILVEKFRLEIKKWKVLYSFNLLDGIVCGGWEYFVIFFGWYLVLKGDLTIGALVATQLYLTILSGSLKEVAGMVDLLVSGSIASERIFDFLNLEKESFSTSVMSSSTTTDFNPKEKLPNIEFKEVCFEYTKEKPVLCNISFKIPPGSFFGITGPSGVGKTTLIHLLLRLFEYDSGEISINGIDIKDLAVDDLRRYFSYVPQKPFLFHASIKDNIRYGDKPASDAEIEKAAVAAGAHNFISEMESGYNTVLYGTEGISLSEGQKQRIGLARALLRNAPILILDEFTLALDSVIEKDIFTNIKRYYSGKTVILVSHKIAQLMEADLVLVLYDRQVNQLGTPKELLKMSGLFKKLYYLQSKFADVSEVEYNDLERIICE